MSFSQASLEVPVFLDTIGSLFVASVGVITLAVMVFSKDYMAAEAHTVRFHGLVGLFVLSMVVLIVRPNLFRLVLGWDGLGVTSFLLVIYFQSPKALSAGMLTAITNRLGDVTLMVLLVLFVTRGRWELWASARAHGAPSLALAALVVATGITKSAQVPFSA